MRKVNGNNIIQQISVITLLFTDEEIKKHFSEDAAKVLKKCAERIEQTYQRGRKGKDEIL